MFLRSYYCCSYRCGKQFVHSTCAPCKFVPLFSETRGVDARLISIYLHSRALLGLSVTIFTKPLPQTSVYGDKFIPVFIKSKVTTFLWWLLLIYISENYSQFYRTSLSSGYHSCSVFWRSRIQIQARISDVLTWVFMIFFHSSIKLSEIYFKFRPWPFLQFAFQVIPR
jgi:hypothetical protein